MSDESVATSKNRWSKAFPKSRQGKKRPLMPFYIFKLLNLIRKMIYKSFTCKNWIFILHLLKILNLSFRMKIFMLENTLFHL